jgi:hypothetical protein
MPASNVTKTKETIVFISSSIRNGNQPFRLAAASSPAIGSFEPFEFTQRATKPAAVPPISMLV